MSAASSPVRSAEAYPSRMIAASRAPNTVLRSMAVMIWRSSITLSGRACRRGATPWVRRSPARTWRTVWWAIGLASPWLRCTWLIAQAVTLRLVTAIPASTRSVR